MKRRNVILIAGSVLLVVAVLVSWRFVRQLWPVIGPRAPIPSGASAPLTAPPGWTVSLLTDKVPGARVLALDEMGNVWVSQTSQGTVSVVYLHGLAPGTEPQVAPTLTGLKNPHGLAFDGSMLYVATETSIKRIPTYGDGSLQDVAPLPSGGRHVTRSLAFGPDGRLYVSIGSTCDTCHEKNPENGSVISMKKDGTDRKFVATGLRNAVYIAFHPHAGQLWVGEMGRDNLGDTVPPDEIDVIDTRSAPKNFGWPICYGNRIHDTSFDTNVYIRDPCADTEPPFIALPAHVAPLGLGFLSNVDLVVSYHGSWNSSVPVGYKVVRWHFDGHAWSESDFLTGFLKGAAAIGRPTGVLVMPDGSVLVADDKAGAIWRMTPTT